MGLYKALPDNIKAEISGIEPISAENFNIMKNDCPSEYGLNNIDDCPSFQYCYPRLKAICWERAVDEI